MAKTQYRQVGSATTGGRRRAQRRSRRVNRGAKDIRGNIGITFDLDKLLASKWKLVLLPLRDSSD